MPLVLLVPLLLLAGPTLVSAQHQTEIAISGPWILYQDNKFEIRNPDGTITGYSPVLIAIAPTGAIDPNDIGFSDRHKPDGRHHRPPQLSTGDGYYITNQNIYCLASAPSQMGGLTCDMKWSAKSTTDKSVPIKILCPMTSCPKGHWDWWTVVTGKTVQTALILPMPDSITNDGTWGVKFAKDFDESGAKYTYDTDPHDTTSNPPPIKNHSTGLVLHYKDGPNQWGLVQCASAPAKGHQYFGPGDCTQLATIGNNRTDTHLENSDTLRIQMKAPYNADGCDIHVRQAHRQMTYLLGFKDIHNFIEPAYYLDANNIDFDKPSSHYCLTREKQKLGTNLPKTAVEAAYMLHETDEAEEDLEVPLPTAEELTKFVNDFATVANSFDGKVGTKVLAFDPAVSGTNSTHMADDESTDIYDRQDFFSANQAVNQASEIRQTFNPDFPRISQVVRMATLLQSSREKIARFRNNNLLKLQQNDWNDLLNKLDELHRRLKLYNGPAKSAGDCLAMAIQVVDHP